MRNIFFVFLLFSIFFGCTENKTVFSKKPLQGRVVSRIEKVIRLKDFNSTTNPADISGISEKLFFYGEKRGESFIVHLISLNNRKEKKIILKKGKGPGEVQYPMSVKIAEGKIHILDMGLRKIVIYTLTGNYIDEIVIKGDIGFPHTFAITKNYFIFNGSLRNKIAIVDKKNGNVIKNYVYEKPLPMPQKGKNFLGGILKADYEKDQFLLGYYNTPYRIEKYDKNGNLLLRMKRKVNFSLIPCRWNLVNKSYPIPTGHFAVPSFALFKSRLYVSPVEGYKIKQNKMIRLKSEHFISVFDTENGKWIKKIEIIGLKKGKSISIIGVNENHIFLIIDSSALQNDNNSQKNEKYLVLLKKGGLK